ncbi:putative metallopeptidase [Ensifer sp. 22564]|uniref:putative metallopeptidase n=1 Tax=Ensifer sp. 22564 TaxID=3453943 RepID=UPI003F84C204
MAAPELEAWARDTFIDPDGDMFNPDHAHLIPASIGMLWTSVSNSKRGRTLIGQAEMGRPAGMMGKWARARAEAQVLGWFGLVPDFIITIDANFWVSASDAQACALIEHELYHAAQDVDAFGAPKFSKSTGRPVFVIRGHDVEEFVGVVRRYGADAAGVRAMVDAANQKPEIARVQIAHACGTCQLRVA